MFHIVCFNFVLHWCLASQVGMKIEETIYNYNSPSSAACLLSIVSIKGQAFFNLILKYYIAANAFIIIARQSNHVFWYTIHGDLSLNDLKWNYNWIYQIVLLPGLTVMPRRKLPFVKYIDQHIYVFMLNNTLTTLSNFTKIKVYRKYIQ